jgi:hypothetical protein
LRDINIKNKRLNNRKLQKLTVIIEEVSNEVSSQRNDIRQIHNFLNSDEKKITGGHKVSLKDNDEDAYSPGWMNLFTENINKDLGLGVENSLFELDESEKIISNDLEKFPALKDKLLQAFYRSGGSNKLKPEIKELLKDKQKKNLLEFEDKEKTYTILEGQYGKYIKIQNKKDQKKKNNVKLPEEYKLESLTLEIILDIIDKHFKKPKKKFFKKTK